MEFHTSCVSDPPTSNCAPILLAERHPVLYSKVPPARIKRSKVETCGNEAMDYGLPFTAWPQYRHSEQPRGEERQKESDI